MHPRSLEETVRVACGKRFAVLTKNNHRTRFLGEFEHVVRKFNNAARKSRFVIGREMRVFYGLVVTVTLQLSAPYTAEIDVMTSVVIAEHCHVDAVAATNRVRLRDERTFRSVAYSNTHTENVVTVFQREIEVILSVLARYIAVPKLTSRPRNIGHTQRYAVVCNLAVHHIVC